MTSITYAVQSEKLLNEGQVLSEGDIAVFVTTPAGEHLVGEVTDVGRLTLRIKCGKQEFRIFRCFVLRKAAEQSV